MSRQLLKMMTAGILIVGVAACDEGSGPLGPGGQDPELEAELTVDPDLTEAIVTEAEASLDALSGPAPTAGLFGDPNEENIEEARELLRAARDTFAAAREAWRGGDTEEAARLAEVGRRLVAEALILVFGDEAIDRAFQQVDHLITWLEERVDEGDSDLLARIRELRDQAEMRLDEGDSIGALERLILARQIAFRERTHHRRREMVRHARLAVFMGNAAIELATEIVGDDATERQARLLRHAQEVLTRAERALAAGKFRVAFNLGREVVNITLVAVLMEDGTDRSKLDSMIELSERAISAAEEAVADVDDELPHRLVELARRLQDRGLEIADTHPRRAIQVLWHASTLAFGVVQLVG